MCVKIIGYNNAGIRPFPENNKDFLQNKGEFRAFFKKIAFFHGNKKEK